MSPRNRTAQHEPYGSTERELAFKLLAAHALADHDFFERLRAEPEGAAAELHIRLTKADVDYLRNDVEWGRIAAVLRPAEDDSRDLGPHEGGLRDALHLDKVTNSW